jgi:short-subunit dehydrogenase
MKNTALITGASSGIGRELALIHASHQGDLILTARSESKLIELKSEIEQHYKVEVKIIVRDLSQRNAPVEIFEALSKENIQIDFLINNAGFGGFGYFHEREMAKDLEMIDLNIIALTKMTKLFLPAMIKRNSGKIMNLASIAAFMPGPMQAIYFATKAYVLSLSHAIATEIENTNVTITTVCPGPVVTNFAKSAEMENSKLFKNGDTPDRVAKKAYKAMIKGKREIITDCPMKFAIKAVIPFVPLKPVLKVVKKMQEK